MRSGLRAGQSGGVFHSALAARLQAVVDGLAQAIRRDRHDGNGGGACGVQRAQGGEQVGGGFGEIAGWAEVDASGRHARGTSAPNASRASPARTSRASRRSLRRRRVVAGQHAGRGRRDVLARRRRRRAGRGRVRCPRAAMPPRRRMTGVAAGRVDDGRFQADGVAPPSRIICHAVAEIGRDVRGRRRADMAGAVGAGRRDGQLGGAQQRLRDRDAPARARQWCRGRRWPDRR